MNSLQTQFYGKLTCEQEGFLLGERGEKKIPDTFANRLPPLRYFTFINDVFSCHAAINVSQ